MAAVESFPAIATRGARVLILGSMPGVRSLQANQYYAHPQNAFWPIVGAVLGFDPALPYRERTRALCRAGVAMWDVLQSCEREGSLDSAIKNATIRTNDFAALFCRHRGLRAVLCNGATAFAKFDRLVRPVLTEAGYEPEIVRMPSTSPANAGMPRARKHAVWRRELERWLA